MSQELFDLLDETEAILETESLPSVSSCAPIPTPPPIVDKNTQPGETCKKKRKRGIDSSQHLLQVVADKISNMTEEETEDESAQFGKLVATQMRAMSKVCRCVTQKVISEALFLGTMDIIDPSAHVVNGPN